MKRALLIGIEYNRNSDIYIPGCYNDVLMVRDVLKNKFNYTDSEIIILTDSSVENNYTIPTAKNIYNTFSNIVNESDKFSQFVFHYSGHGKYIKDTTSDEIDFNDEVIVPMDYRTNGVISDDQINALVQKIKCPTMMLFDCCHSGTICDLPYSWNKKQNNYEITENNKTSNYQSNILKLSSSLDNELSVSIGDLAGQYYGVFTKNIVYELYGLDTKTTTIKEFADKVNTTIKKMNLSQTVNISSSNKDALNKTLIEILGELETTVNEDYKSLLNTLESKDYTINILRHDNNNLKEELQVTKLDLNTIQEQKCVLENKVMELTNNLEQKDNEIKNVKETFNTMQNSANKELNMLRKKNIRNNSIIKHNNKLQAYLHQYKMLRGMK